jgi:hypothetical protein
MDDGEKFNLKSSSELEIIAVEAKVKTIYVYFAHQA